MSLARWFLSLWLVTGMLLPGLEALRVCGCDGSFSFDPCACEAPVPQAPTGCCLGSASNADEQSGPCIGDSERAPCTGCVSISIPAPAPGVSANAPVAVAFALPPAIALAMPVMASVSRARVEPPRDHDPPRARRHRELRV